MTGKGMDRRRFTAQMLAAAGGVALGGWPRALAGVLPGGWSHGAPGVLRQEGASPEWRDLRVDGTRLNGALEALARGAGGWREPNRRVAYSDEDLRGRDEVRELMEAAGLSTRIDAAGNLLGLRPGSEEGLPPLMTGSHIDSVPDGGHYDGPLGVLAAVEVSRRLREEGLVLRHPLEVAVFANEEGGKTGSRAMSGEVTPLEWEIPTASGHTIGEGTLRLGGDPDRVGEVLRGPGSVAAFVELHIEQGAVLERRGIDVGVVEGIVGIRRWNVQVDGETNHAGTTPMEVRSDALVAAARFVDAVFREVGGLPGSAVATVGRIEAIPGAPNVIPGRVRLSLEVRDLELEVIDTIRRQLGEVADGIGAGTGTSFSFQPFYLSRPAPCAPAIQDGVEAAAGGLGLTSLRMPSGAGHDAQSIAMFAPVGMIFVPSAGGISHSPEEYTAPADVANGADVLLRTLLALDSVR